jgi:GAF domain-containing protein
LPKNTRDNSIRKEAASKTQAKSKLNKKNRSNEIGQGKFLLDLYHKALLLPEKDFNDYFLDYAVNITESTLGFFHFISDDQKSIILTAWNGQALKNCVANYTSHYPIESAGNWVDCLRLKHPVIYNDFAKSPNQKGLPSGHVLIKRFMSIPIFEDDKVKIVFGVGNKIDEYTEDDVVQLQLIANELAKINKQRQAENKIHES